MSERFDDDGYDYEDPRDGGPDDSPTAPERNAMVKRSFDGVAVLSQNAATQALTAKATADINARWMIAMHRPRAMEVVRERLLRECKRPGFAATALYSVPRGKGKVTGLTIRFAEAALVAMGNLGCEAVTLYDSDTERVVRIAVTDYEGNAAWSKDITISKTKEVRELRNGQRAMSERVNSYGDVVYRVEATEDDVAVKEAAAISKASRTGILRLVPGWLLSECRDQVDKTTRSKAAEDPDGERRRMLDEFAKLGLKATWLVDWLGHTVDEATPDEIADLRQLYRAIREKEITPAAAMAERKGEPAGKPASVAASAVTRRNRREPPAGAKAPGDDRPLTEEEMRAYAAAEDARAARQ
jgi:hypothetical protein